MKVLIFLYLYNCYKDLIKELLNYYALTLNLTLRLSE